jgi:hypothetical protein
VAQLIQYAGSFQTSANRMRISNGCGHDQLTFQDHNDTILRNDDVPYDMTNVNAPPDERCHFFSSDGGGNTPQLLAAEISKDRASVPSNFLHPQSIYPLQTRVLGVGSDSTDGDSTDYVLAMGRITREACLLINEKFGVVNPAGEPPRQLGQFLYTPGDFSGITNALGSVAPELEGHTTFCFQFDGADTPYHLMQVLVAR